MVTVPTPNRTGYKTIWLKPVKGAASHLVRTINDSLAEGLRTFKKIKDGGEGLYPQHLPTNSGDNRVLLLTGLPVSSVPINLR